MSDWTAASLLAEGFAGFVALSTLSDDAPPDGPGVYVVLRIATAAPEFVHVSPAGHFKGRDPTVDPAVLEPRWVPEAPVVYIGKATSLHDRLRTFRRFGTGRPAGHWGGRYIWQLHRTAADLIVAWKTTIASGNPRHDEIALMARFRAQYGSLPYANINS